MVYYRLINRTTNEVVQEFDRDLDAEIALIESERDDLVIRRIEVKKPSRIKGVLAALASLLGL